MWKTVKFYLREIDLFKSFTRLLDQYKDYKSRLNEKNSKLYTFLITFEVSTTH